MDIHISEHDVHCIATAVYVEVNMQFHDDSIDMKYIWNKKPNVTIGRMVFY